MEKFFIVIFSVLICLSNSQLVYPDDDDNPVIRPQKKEIRQPVYIPGECPENEWYWPGNSENDWVCDCAARFVYHTPSEKCHEAYKRGPCRRDEYLIIPKGKSVAECVRNPCSNDGMVFFNGSCYQLHKTDACVAKGGGSLSVNGTTLELQCSTKAAELNIINVGNISCPPGSKRVGKGCRTVVGG